jgi:hypothetical protein
VSWQEWSASGILVEAADDLAATVDERHPHRGDERISERDDERPADGVAEGTSLCPRWLWKRYPPGAVQPVRSFSLPVILLGRLRGRLDGLVPLGSVTREKPDTDGADCRGSVDIEAATEMATSWRLTPSISILSLGGRVVPIGVPVLTGRTDVGSGDRGPSD